MHTIRRPYDFAITKMPRISIMNQNRPLQSISDFLLRKAHLERYTKLWIILIVDMMIATIATTIALAMSSYLIPEFSITAVRLLEIDALSLVFSGIAYGVFKTYRSVIRHSTMRDILKLSEAVFLKEAMLLAAYFIAPTVFEGCNIAILIILDMLLSICLLISTRVMMIVTYDLLLSQQSATSKHRRKRVLIYGTGDKQVALITRLHKSPHYIITGFINYGRKLRSYRISDLPIFWFTSGNDLKKIYSIQHFDAVLFHSYDEAREEKDRLIKACGTLGINVLIAPAIDEVIDGKLMQQNVREIKIEDLLGRPEIKISMDEIIAGFKGKTIMVTGAAGSIGSELCRQLSNFDIRELILFDNAETPMHNIRIELEERYPNLKFIPVIGDVRSARRLDFAFRTYKPQVVFHAAAYKHVPLMEENPCEAICVNVAGTRNIADMCIRYNAEKMVMISTDKAVNPTNVMGASKRLAEIYVQSLGQAISRGGVAGTTKFITTRFGNVLGSNGSVIPRFREQIMRGGPVTVTHPDITRFFMTIPEACRLVMEAATMSRGNEIFVFDMGESVKIADLAKRMIELAGFEVDKEIHIEYTGLRPGEKLYEEVLSNSENTLPTPHEKIRIAKVREYEYENARQAVEQLEAFALAVDVPSTVRLMKSTVPEFKSQNSRFEEYDKEYSEETEDTQTITATEQVTA